jgi:hypothetical protein
MDLAEARALAQASLRIELERGASTAALDEVLRAYRVGAAAAGPGNGAAAARGAPIARPGNSAPGAAPPAAAAAPVAGAGCRVVMRYANELAAADIVLPDLWRVRGDDRLIEDLRAQAKVRAAFCYA